MIRFASSYGFFLCPLMLGLLLRERLYFMISSSLVVWIPVIVLISLRVSLVTPSVCQ